MVNLTIDGKEVALDAGFSLQMNRDNSFFETRGDYTYEIEISLSCDSNKQIYQGIQRPNTKFDKTGRRAVLREGPRMLISGLEVILSKEDDKVKIQIVANESEFNFIISEKMSIRNIGLPDIELPTTERQLSAMNVGKYPEFKGALPFVYESDPGWGWNAENYNAVPYDEEKTYIIQPYLLWIVDMVVEKLGYHIGSNYLDSVDKYKRLIIASGVRTNETSKILPDWTVEEFITEVEKFFGVVFVFHSATRTLDIVKIDDFYASAGTVAIEDSSVIDSYDEEFTEDAAPFQTQYKNVSYDHADNEYWQIADMDDELYERCRKENLNIDSIETEIEDIDQKDQVVYVDKVHTIEWINYVNSEGVLHRTMINMFKGVKSDYNVSENKLRIIPSKVAIGHRIDDGGDYYVCGLVPEMFEENEGTLSEMVRGEKDSAPSVMQVAYYLGVVRPKEYTGEDDVFRGKVPMPAIARWVHFSGQLRKFGQAELGEEYRDSLTLELIGPYGRIAQELSNRVKIDTKHKYAYSFLTNNILDPKKIYIIHNVKYACASLEYKIENGKLSKVVTGIFYPMN
ncbi:MAG: hypothetical protein MJZ41_06295 [Bacteroidaceae bacterium]|nr:hypothetical protein [Bacteroidaceae bacterium]